MFAPRAVARHVRLLRSNPKYFRARLRVLLYQQLHPHSPWLTADAIGLLQRYLKPSMRGFEWGSGRSSTTHFAFSACRDGLKRANITSVDYRLLPTRPENLYVSAIQDFPDEHFDFILIDGQCREECLAAAVPKLKRDGLVVLDNADAGYQEPADAALTRMSTDNGIWRTDILTKRRLTLS